MERPMPTGRVDPFTRTRGSGRAAASLSAALPAALLALVVFVTAGCTTPTDYPIQEFASFDLFVDALEGLASDGQRAQVDALWNSLVAKQRIPFIQGDRVAFLYRGRARSVQWVGDFTAWQNGPVLQGRRMGRSDIWVAYATFPTNARVEYRIVVDGKAATPDRANPLQQWGGFGPNSVVAMPDYVFPPEVMPRDGVAPGALSPPVTISSAHLGYAVDYRVYAPAHYQELDDLPVIYVTDAHEYTDPRMGSMPIVLDNLIAEGAIEPVLAVFIDPRDAKTGQNRRQSEYLCNPLYAAFIAQELVPAIDSAYKTDASPDRRAILGESYGGVNAAYCGLTYPDVFHLVAMQSPAFTDDELYRGYRSVDRLPLRVFLSTGYSGAGGPRWDLDASTMTQILEEKGYPLLVMEVPEGHSWGQWRAQLDDLLIYFFGTNNTYGA